MSLFLLALYIFLQSAPAFNWFTVDPKFIAFVGIVFVIAILVEGFFVYRGRHPFWHKAPAA